MIAADLVLQAFFSKVFRDLAGEEDDESVDLLSVTTCESNNAADDKILGEILDAAMHQSHAWSYRIDRVMDGIAALVQRPGKKAAEAVSMRDGGLAVEAVVREGRVLLSCISSGGRRGNVGGADTEACMDVIKAPQMLNTLVPSSPSLTLLDEVLCSRDRIETLRQLIPTSNMKKIYIGGYEDRPEVIHLSTTSSPFCQGEVLPSWAGLVGNVMRLLTDSSEVLVFDGELQVTFPIVRPASVKAPSVKINGHSVDENGEVRLERLFRRPSRDKSFVLWCSVTSYGADFVGVKNEATGKTLLVRNAQDTKIEHIQEDVGDISFVMLLVKEESFGGGAANVKHRYFPSIQRHQVVLTTNDGRKVRWNFHEKSSVSLGYQARPSIISIFSPLASYRYETSYLIDELHRFIGEELNPETVETDLRGFMETIRRVMSDMEVASATSEEARLLMARYLPASERDAMMPGEPSKIKRELRAVAPAYEELVSKEYDTMVDEFDLECIRPYKSLVREVTYKTVGALLSNLRHQQPHAHSSEWIKYKPSVLRGAPKDEVVDMVSE